MSKKKLLFIEKDRYFTHFEELLVFKWCKKFFFFLKFLTPQLKKSGTEKFYWKSPILISVYPLNMSGSYGLLSENLVGVMRKLLNTEKNKLYLYSHFVKPQTRKFSSPQSHSLQKFNFIILLYRLSSFHLQADLPNLF